MSLLISFWLIYPLFEMSKRIYNIQHTLLFYLKHTATSWHLMTYKIKYDTRDLMRASLKKTQWWGLGFLRRGGVGGWGTQAQGLHWGTLGGGGGVKGAWAEEAAKEEEVGKTRALCWVGPQRAPAPICRSSEEWGGGAFALPPSLFCSAPPHPPTLSLSLSQSVSLPLWSC